MSNYFDYDDWAFTEDEINAGIPEMLRAEAYELRREVHRKRISKEKQKEDLEKLFEQMEATAKRESISHKNAIIKMKIKEVVNLIAGLKNNVQIQNKVLKKLYHDYLDDMIIRYSQAERVPFEYIRIAKQENCLRILISNYLKKSGGYSLTQVISDEIDFFIDEILRNDELEIAYQRVHKIQKFIHGKIDQKYGNDKHLFLPAKGMKYLLSTARLHLNIIDFKYKDVNSLKFIINQSNKQAEHNYKIDHIKAIVPRQVSKKLDAILNLDKTISVDHFKRKIIHIYAG